VRPSGSTAVSCSSGSVSVVGRGQTDSATTQVAPVRRVGRSAQFVLCEPDVQVPHGDGLDDLLGAQVSRRRQPALVRLMEQRQLSDPPETIAYA
jgi:hypothetical protein